jgi:hypothetical protein
MDDKKFNTDQKSNPEKVYQDELNEKGSTFTDNEEESEARDQAKIQKAASGQSQKIDGGNPYADEDTVSDEEVNREYYDDDKGQ